jgi:hypothetical protein
VIDNFTFGKVKMGILDRLKVLGMMLFKLVYGIFRCMDASLLQVQISTYDYGISVIIPLMMIRNVLKFSMHMKR